MGLARLRARDTPENWFSQSQMDQVASLNLNLIGAICYLRMGSKEVVRRRNSKVAGPTQKPRRDAGEEPSGGRGSRVLFGTRSRRGHAARQERWRAQRAGQPDGDVPTWIPRGAGAFRFYAPAGRSQTAAHACYRGTSLQGVFSYPLLAHKKQRPPRTLQ